MTATDLARPGDDPAWHQFRAEGITATDVAKAASGRYGGAYAVVAAKLGLVPPVELNDRMERGHRWQPIIADITVRARHLYVVGEEHWLYHPERPTHRATLDGFLSPIPDAGPADLVAVWECKTRAPEVRPDWGYWAAQVQWQLWVTGLARAVLAEAVIDDDTDRLVALKFHPIDADPYEQARLVDLADQLAAHLAAGTLPDPDGGALEVVKAVTAVADPEAEVVHLDDVADLLVRYHELKVAAAAIKAESDEIQAVVRARLGAATKGVTEHGWTATVAKPRLVLDEDAVLAAHPGCAKQVLDRALFEHVHGAKALDPYKRPTGARNFTVNPPKETR